MRSTRLLVAVAAVGCVSVSAGMAPAGAAVSSVTRNKEPNATVRVIVRAVGGDTATARQSVLKAGGRVVAVQQGLGTLVADVTDPAGLRALPAVDVVSPDASVQAQSLGTDSSGQPGSM